VCFVAIVFVTFVAYRETLNGSRDPLMAIASKPPRTGSPVPSRKKSIDQNALVAK
jgi:hypothetical protein